MRAFMPRMAHLGIRARLLGGFSSVLALIIILTFVGIDQVNRINHDLTTINDVNGVKLRHAIDWRGSVHDRAILLRDMVMVTQQDELERLRDDYQQLADNYRAASGGMDAVITANAASREERRLLDVIDDQAEHTNALVDEIMAARNASNVNEARNLLLNSAGPAFFQWLDDINAFIDHQEAKTASDTASARETASSFQVLMLALCIAALVIGGLIAYLLSRQLLRELGAEPHEVKAFAEAIGRGDLTTEGKLRNGDRRSIMAAQVSMARQLHDIVSQVRIAAESVASNSEQIAEGNSELASRTEQQASALSQTASAMEELNGTVTQNSDNAEQASHEAEGASDTAKRGGEAVHQVTGTMRELDESSSEIASIISTIDNIAFQTNILALNASVEAARAGEHGRGFAVVAAEVRKLAQNSAAAAQEITDQIKRNGERVEHGNQRAAEASQATEDIVAAIGRVSQIMREISHASAEQRAGVQEAGTAVTQMDQVTQQNSSLVQESASAAENLQQHAQQLMAAMSAFRLPAGNTTDNPSPTAIASAPSASRVAASPAGRVPARGQHEPEWESF